jgi:hypothetical protein
VREAIKWRDDGEEVGVGGGEREGTGGITEQKEIVFQVCKE